MEKEEILRTARLVKGMIEETAEFEKEFAELDVAQLGELIKAQQQIAEDAEYKLNAAETELQLRALRIAIQQPNEGGTTK